MRLELVIVVIKLVLEILRLLKETKKERQTEVVKKIDVFTKEITKARKSGDTSKLEDLFSSATK
jgi:uncharacterized membrane protein (DUF106 family)